MGDERQLPPGRRIVVPRARPDPDASFVVFRGRDGYRVSLPLEDLMADTTAGPPRDLAVPAHPPAPQPGLGCAHHERKVSGDAFLGRNLRSKAAVIMLHDFR